MTNVTRIGLLCLLLAAREARADLALYATESGAGNSTLGTLDLTTGRFTATSNLSVAVRGLTVGGGTLYASDTNGFLDTISGGVATRFGSATAPVPPGGAQAGEFGLAYANGFYAENINGFVTGASPAALDHYSADGNSVATVGPFGPAFSLVASGGLAFGPGGTLYLSAADAAGNAALYSVDTATGAATEIGAGLGTSPDDVVTLAYAGGRLYGIDTVQPGGSGPVTIYTIDAATGVATATGIVTGLTAGFTLDTASAVVPEPSTYALLGVLGGAVLGYSRLRRERAS